jgi:hypothetical protein
MAALLLASPLVRADAKDDAMRHLASKSGCFICHGIELDASGPDGSSGRLARRGRPSLPATKGDKNAVKTLTGAVIGGTSPIRATGKTNPTASPCRWRWRRDPGRRCQEIGRVDPQDEMKRGGERYAKQ